ncbi:TPA: ABC transporter ATP-binding protein [Candidatus Poribacteria bacterium]|nr:ABC transporter ATP-binding protein [Candidatus Poribacteria bacterium]HEX30059.1 ABC transporter ATP-binding protein [Candidatus Poribacteria bacterium]
MWAVELEKVTVSYRENVALKEVTLRIKEGEFLAVIGPNGAGKTTLLTTINGLGKVISGTVRVFGRELSRWNVLKIRKEIGYVPQELPIDPRSPVSVREAVMIGRAGRIGLLRRPGREDINLVESVMELTGIKHLAERPIGHLSGGERQKVSIARALAQEPKILLLDEPTSNLDPKAQVEIVELIERIYDERKLTIVFVTHILSLIPPSCSRAVLMKGGRIIWSGETKEALKEEHLLRLYESRRESPLHTG